MKIDKSMVHYVARLARLQLSEDEVEQMAKQLSKILDYIDQLRELDTREVPPTSNVLDTVNALREDEPVKTFSVDEALANAPEREGEFLKVPRIIADHGDAP